MIKFQGLVISAHLTAVLGVSSAGIRSLSQPFTYLIPCYVKPYIVFYNHNRSLDHRSSSSECTLEFSF